MRKFKAIIHTHPTQVKLRWERKAGDASPSATSVVGAERGHQ